jgi:hypothetical protein
MSAPIGPGEWLLCIAVDGPGAVHVGGVYHVARLGCAGRCEVCPYEGPCLELTGIQPDAYRGYCPCQFRPLGGGASNHTQVRKQPAPERELADA